MTRVIALPPEAALLADGAKLGGWWHDSPDGSRIVCDLCPRACALKPGDRGFCFVRENRDGQMVLANPDFVARLKTNAPMNEANRNAFFGGTAEGYTDYPSLSEAQGA